MHQSSLERQEYCEMLSYQVCRQKLGCSNNTSEATVNFCRELTVETYFMAGSAKTRH